MRRRSSTTSLSDVRILGASLAIRHASCAGAEESDPRWDRIAPAATEPSCSDVHRRSCYTEVLAKPSTRSCRSFFGRHWQAFSVTKDELRAAAGQLVHRHERFAPLFGRKEAQH